MKILKLFLISIVYKFKAAYTYKKDFMIGICSTLIISLCSILFIESIFLNISGLEGLGKYEFLLIYFLTTFSISVYHFMFSGLLDIPGVYVKNGMLDEVLVKPIDPLAYILIDGIYFPNIIDVITNFIIIVIIFPQAGITGVQCALSIILSIFGAFLIGALATIVSSLSFVFTETLLLIKLVANLADFIKYPISIYPKVLRVLLTYIVPLAMITIVPMNIFSVISTQTTVIIIAISCLLILLSIAIFKRSIKLYRPTGT